MAQSILRSTLPGRQAFVRRLPGAASNRPASAVASPVVLLRGSLVLGCVLTLGITAWVGDPGSYLHADPALARLLRGMALIKGLIAIAAAGAVFWRLAWPVSRTVAAGYIVSASVLTGSAMLVWQLSYIVPAALLFHTAALALLWVGWRER